MTGAADSEGDEIELITLDRGEMHIGQTAATKMRSVHQQKAKDASSLPVFTAQVDRLQRVVVAKARRALLPTFK